MKQIKGKRTSRRRNLLQGSEDSSTRSVRKGKGCFAEEMPEEREIRKFLCEERSKGKKAGPNKRGCDKEKEERKPQAVSPT